MLKQHQLFVARDPMGIKPLYYAQTGSHFLFASEIRTLLGTGLIPRKIDSAGLLSYLAFGSVYEPATWIEGIRMLAPGCYLTWNQGDVREQSYWDLNRGAANKDSAEAAVSRRDLEERVHAVIDESVRMQLVSDVPVGVFLSGGIDSSSLVGILSRSGVRPSTISIVFREAEFSEAEHSRAVATSFQTDHHEITVSQDDVLHAIPAAIAAMDQPTVDGNQHLFCFPAGACGGCQGRAVRVRWRRVVRGLFKFCDRASHGALQRNLEACAGFVAAATARMFTGLRPESDQNRKLAALIRENGRLVHPYFLTRMLFTPKQQEGLSKISNRAARDRFEGSLRERLDATERLDPVNRVSYLESRCYMLNTLLRDSDFMSMAHGLEVRVPLIDHHLAEQAMKLPGMWKVNKTDPKPLLVDALRGALPASIVHRPKRGFTLPFEQWVRASLRPEVEGALGKIAAGALGSELSESGSQAVWDDFMNGKTSWTRPWALFVAQRWCEQNM
jgi:asparagine synthase (glutamine-hydrolysing)